MVGNPFTEGEVDAARVVDEEAQRFFARLLERDQIDLVVELTELLLNVLLEVCHWVKAEKKVGQAHFSYALRIEKAWISIARLVRLPSLAAELVDPVQDRVGDRVLGGLSYRAVPGAIDQRDCVFLRLETDLGIRDVVEDH